MRSWPCFLTGLPTGDFFLEKAPIHFILPFLWCPFPYYMPSPTNQMQAWYNPDQPVLWFIEATPTLWLSFSVLCLSLSSAHCKNYRTWLRECCFQRPRSLLLFLHRRNVTYSSQTVQASWFPVTLQSGQADGSLIMKTDGHFMLTMWQPLSMIVSFHLHTIYIL